jgi:hypothetical protein
MVEWGITIWCCLPGAVWAWTRRSEEKWTWVRHLETYIKLTFSTPYPQFMLHLCHCHPSSSQFPLLLQGWPHATTAIVLHCAAHYNMNPSYFVVIGISSALSWRYPKAQQPNKNWFSTNWKGSTFSLQKTSYARIELQKGYRLGNRQELLGYQSSQAKEVVTLHSVTQQLELVTRHNQCELLFLFTHQLFLPNPSSQPSPDFLSSPISSISKLQKSIQNLTSHNIESSKKARVHS